MEVSLHLYDLSQGMARSMSQQLLGIQLEGIWHSGIVCYGKEYFFGGGIFSDTPAMTPYGRPDKRLSLGSTSKTAAEFEAFLDTIRPRFRMQDYDLLRHNCNNFTDECSKFLTGTGIPQDIIELPTRALNTPLGRMILPQIEAYQASKVAEYSGIDASIGGGSGGGELHPHENLPVPLFKLGSPIAHSAGALGKAVERLGQLLREAGHEALLTANIQGLEQLPNAAGIAHTSTIDATVGDLLKALDSLDEPNRYPVLDMLRVTCLHPRGLELVLASENALKILLESKSKLTTIAAQRLLQNMLLRPVFVKSPLDVAIAKFIVDGMHHA